MVYIVVHFNKKNGVGEKTPFYTLRECKVPTTKWIPNAYLYMTTVLDTNTKLENTKDTKVIKWYYLLLTSSQRQ